MPRHHQDNTSEEGQTENPVNSIVENFQMYLREQIRQATRLVMEEVMNEELTQFVGAKWGEHDINRKGYRNGFYARDLQTTNGLLDDLQVPRDRAGAFQTQMFDQYQRYEPQIAEGLTQMYVTGISTQKVGEVAKTLMGVAPSASTISRLNQSLSDQYEEWRIRPLLNHYRILYLDGVYFSVRHGEKADEMVILTALAVDLEGNKEVLTLRTCAEESKDGWGCLLQDLRSRGVQELDLIMDFWA